MRVAQMLVLQMEEYVLQRHVVPKEGFVELMLVELMGGCVVHVLVQLNDLLNISGIREVKILTFTKMPTIPWLIKSFIFHYNSPVR